MLQFCESHKQQKSVILSQKFTILKILWFYDKISIMGHEVVWNVVKCDMKINWNFYGNVVQKK